MLIVSESENNNEKRKNKIQIKNSKSYSNILDYSYSYHPGSEADEVYCPEDNEEDNNNNINDLSNANSEELNISNDMPIENNLDFDLNLLKINDDNKWCDIPKMIFDVKKGFSIDEYFLRFHMKPPDNSFVLL